MEEHVLEIIKHLKAEKVRQGKAPSHILDRELSEAINDALVELQLEGKINTGQTINNKWIDPT